MKVTKEYLRKIVKETIQEQGENGMEVFAVMSHVRYSGSEVKSMFSSYEKAREYIEKNFARDWEFDGKNRWNYYGSQGEYITIETFTLDEE